MIWFASDYHFGHINIIKYCERPYWALNHMNNDIITRHNSVVGTDDEVYMLGDIAMGIKPNNLKYVEQMNGKKILIPGNHDLCHWSNNDWEDHIALYEQYFDAVYTPLSSEFSNAYAIRMKHINKRLWLNHFPQEDISRHNTKYQEYLFSGNLNDHNWLICGHVHQAWRQKQYQINVGIDANGGYPTNLDTIMEYISKGATNKESIKWTENNEYSTE